MSTAFKTKPTQIPNKHPTKFKSTSSTSKKPILNTNCIHSITNITAIQSIIDFKIFLENMLQKKNPKGRNNTIFPAIFLKANGSVIFLKYGDILLKGMRFKFIIPFCSFSMILRRSDMSASKLPSNFNTTNKIKKAIYIKNSIENILFFITSHHSSLPCFIFIIIFNIIP